MHKKSSLSRKNLKAPIPFRTRSDLFVGGKMKRSSSESLAKYLNVPATTTKVEGKNPENSSTAANSATDPSSWLSNLNVYIDPTSASSFLGGSATGKKAAGEESDQKITWSARDDPGVWREFLIVLLLLSVILALCLGAFNYVLHHDPPPRVLLADPQKSNLGSE